VETDDIADLEFLQEELRAVAGIRVGAVGSEPVLGEEGAALDFLTVALSAGGGLTALIDLLRAVVESRGPAFRLVSSCIIAPGVAYVSTSPTGTGTTALTALNLTTGARNWTAELSGNSLPRR